MIGIHTKCSWSSEKGRSCGGVGRLHRPSPMGAHLQENGRGNISAGYDGLSYFIYMCH